MKRKLSELTWVALVGILFLAGYSCSDGDNGVAMPPKIILDRENGLYVTKVGKPITIAPTYEYADGAVFAWKIDGKIVGREPSFTYQSDDTGEVYLTLEVINSAGTDYKELKISIASLLIPTISMALPEEGYQIPINNDLVLKPEINEYSETTTCKWYVNGSEVSRGKDYTFKSGTPGVYTLKVVAENEDGSDYIEFEVNVRKLEDMPFKWVFESTEFNLSKGRSIRIKIWDIENDFGAKYTWEVNGVKAQEGAETEFVFNKSEIGAYTVKVTMENDYYQVSQNLTVNVCAAEGTYKRPASGGSMAACSKVFEYLAAPGQFINENFTATTMAEANAYALSRMNSTPNPAYVSLGAFGGYVIVGFDHSIENDKSYNIQVIGNSFANSSEPGIVWVMQDENGDGLPNDTWYELKGSEYGKPETKQDYAITYYKPKAPGLPVQWTDNQGKAGSVDYLSQFHRQDYYYPAWVNTPTYTLRGTCLKSRTKETTPGFWTNQDFEWGYADNFSSIDRLTNDDNYNAAANGNHLKISDAVTFDGKPANLGYVDFVKIQGGVNAKAGWLGENSTEVFGVKDFNLLKNKR